MAASVEAGNFSMADRMRGRKAIRCCRLGLDCSRFEGESLCMKMIPSRQLAANPGKVWKALDAEGALIISRDGMPRGLLIATSDATLLEDLQEQVRARARRAVSSVRRRALAAGLAGLAPQEIDREIGAVRQARTQR